MDEQICRRELGQSFFNNYKYSHEDLGFQVNYRRILSCSSSDAIIFSFLGISTISLYHNWDWIFIVVTVGAIVLARFFGTTSLFSSFFAYFFSNFLPHRSGKQIQQGTNLLEASIGSSLFWNQRSYLLRISAKFPTRN